MKDSLFLPDVFEKVCLKTYHLDLAKFLSAPWLAWQADLKETEVNLDLLTDTNLLLMIEKGIRGEICHEIHQYVKTNNRCMKDYDKSKK